MREKRAIYINGYAGIVGLVVLALVGLFFFYLGMWQAKVWALFLSIFLWLIALLLLSSATVVSPNQAKVILFFGQYLGTIRENGFFLTIPLAQKMTVSLKVRNFNSSVLKVNDLDGNPIEISAVVVFKVIDTAKASFDVAYYQDFVEIQSETAIRHIASQSVSYTHLICFWKPEERERTIAIPMIPILEAKEVKKVRPFFVRILLKESFNAVQKLIFVLRRLN